MGFFKSQTCLYKMTPKKYDYYLYELFWHKGSEISDRFCTYEAIYVVPLIIKCNPVTLSESVLENSG